ncbi:MAG: CHAT domain-containing protein [Acidobacteria bacterium]|nr:CHAT domain-containing protein [Acidobacteriota bacterium]
MDSLQELIAQLGALEAEPAREEFLRQHAELHDRAVVLRIAEDAAKTAREDMDRASRLAGAASWLADFLNDDYCRARSARTTGHVLGLSGKYQEALECYQSSLVLFDHQGEEIESGVTLSSSLQPLILLGQYEEAFRRAQRAQQIFERHGDRLRLARLQSNLANILHRQDRFAEARDLYRQAQHALEEFGQHRDVAVALSNLAVCCISLNDFMSALDAYQQARAYCEQHNMPLLLAQADYNIAYLYYLRGEYPRAIELYQATRVFCEKAGDGYHRALCDLDQSEMYLDLRLSKEGAQLAQQAFASFEEMNMGYEAAKALAFLAIASSHQRKPFRALELFDKARQRFVAEQNSVWPALIDLHAALVYYHEGRAFEARRRCDAALEAFAGTPLSGKAALSEVLRAALHLQAQELEEAERWCRAALRRLEFAGTSAVRYQGSLVLGQVQEARDNLPASVEAYRQALTDLEALPVRLHAEELKIAFLPDKLAVYESLVAASMAVSGAEKGKEEAFAVIERAKARQLSDLVAFRAHSLPAPAGTRSGLVEQVKSLREELNWYYRQIDLQELRQEASSAGQIAELRQRTREHEAHLVKTMSDSQASDEEFLSLQNAGTISLDAIRSMLSADSVLLEYYVARGMIYACVVDRERVEVVPVTPEARARTLTRLLQDQFSKFRLGPEYAQSFVRPMREATEALLKELNAELIAPLRKHLQAPRWIIIPHGFLHYLPFHALFDGAKFLIEDFTISYAPSASVFYLSCTKRNSASGGTAILAPALAQRPRLADEVEAITSLIPGAKVFLGDDASEECLQRSAEASCRIHLQTEAVYRRDNPMFSSLRLGRSWLTLFDLYQLRLPVEMIILSGCGPGINSGGNGEELLGLIRGMLYAGAESVLATLWNSPNDSAAAFQTSFYPQLRDNPDRAQVFRRAMLNCRERHPHPYFWAPFILSGKPATT